MVTALINPESQVIHMADEKLIDIGGMRIHCVCDGPVNGDPVLLLHGFPEFWWGWRKQMAELAGAGFRVVAIDMRGYGESDAPPEIGAYSLDRLVEDVVAVANTLNLDRFNLVGHDWGGIVAWAVAARHALLVKRLVILNAPHLDVMSPVIFRRPSQLMRSAYVGFFQIPLLPEVALSMRSYRLLCHALMSTSRPGTFTQGELARYVEQWSRPGRLRAMLNYYRTLVRRQRQALGRIVPPTLILWGCKDHALDAELAKASLLQCANGRMSMHRSATHWLHLEEPEWVNGHLLRFLGEDHELDRPDPGQSDETG